MKLELEFPEVVPSLSRSEAPVMSGKQKDAVVLSLELMLDNRNPEFYDFGPDEDPEAIQEALQQAIYAFASDEPEPTTEHVKTAMEAVHLQICMAVEPEYVDEDDNPEDDVFAEVGKLMTALRVMDLWLRIGKVAF